MKRHVPNIFTCLNLFCGCIAIILIADGQLTTSAYLIFLAAFFDLFDGLSARLLAVQSPFGKQLDSLADVVSFGVVPGAVLYKMLLMSSPGTVFNSDLFRYFPFIVTLFSALRLARFNIDTRQSESFIGLPTPANTLLIVSLPLILANDEYNLNNILLNPYFIVSLSVFQSFLLVSNLPLLALKFKSLSWSDNKYQYVLIILAVFLLAFLKFLALPLIILFYILLSLVKKLSERY